MKHIKKIIQVIMVVLLFSPSIVFAQEDKLAQIKEAGKLVIATSPDFPPREFYIINDKGEREIVGSDISLAKAIADKIGVELEIMATDFNGVLANIQTGSVDFGIAGFVGTKEREKVMSFSDGYQQEASDGYQGLLVTKEVAETYKSLDELKAAKLTIGAQGGTIQYELAQTLTDASKIKQFGTTDAAVLALNSGDIDAMTVSTTSAEPMLTSFPDLVILPQEGFDLDEANFYSTNVIGFPLNQDNESLVTLVNEVIKDARESGQLEAWDEEAKALSAKSVE